MLGIACQSYSWGISRATRMFLGRRRGALPEHHALAEPQLDHALLPALRVREAEDEEGEICGARCTLGQVLTPLLFVAHRNVIGWIIVKLERAYPSQSGGLELLPLSSAAVHA